MKANPTNFFKTPLKLLVQLQHAPYVLPIKQRTHHFEEIQIEDIPQIKCWPMDGGLFVTLPPRVYSEDMNKPGIMNSNLGMYRIQLGGNDYIQNKEIGLHYQIQLRNRSTSVHKC